MSAATYILECADKTYYVGSTNDLDRRFAEHTRGKNKWTKNRRPVKLVFKRTFQHLAEARKFEYFIKRQRNKHFYKKLISAAFV